LCFGAYGKKSNLDIKWKRSFLELQDRKVNNYVGIKYHIRTSWDPSLIGLHNFKNGYCGISAIEENKYCLCYMTHADNLKACGNQIVEMEKRFLHRNPHLQKIFEGSEFLEGFPVTISQINFSGKSQVRDGVIFLGDAAGTITPLCGNGMSMALHSSKLAAECSTAFLEGWVSREKMEHDFSKAWQKQFSHRLIAGRTIQKFFGAEALSNFFVGSFRKLPFLASPVIRLTHGKPF
jgi:flavin-dependent dehydrogenase